MGSYNERKENIKNGSTFNDITVKSLNKINYPDIISDMQQMSENISIIQYSKGNKIKEESVRGRNNELIKILIPVDNHNNIIGNQPILYFNQTNQSKMEFILPNKPKNSSIFQSNIFSNLSIEEAKQFLLHGCNISPQVLDDKGTTQSGWRIGQKNGHPFFLKEYKPPIGWTAIGLRVLNLYDNKDNTWIGTNIKFGEWYIGYHGVRDVKAIIGICNEGFKRGPRQIHQNSPNENPLNNFKYHKCGEGVYFTPDIEEAKAYALPIDYNNHKYRIIFMCRINPYEVRIANLGDKEYWIVEGDLLGDMLAKNRTDLVRHYRILVLREQ